MLDDHRLRVNAEAVGGFIAHALGDLGGLGVLGARGRLLVAAITAGTFLAVAASQYLLWTPVGADYIDGIQGRYLLPLAPAAALPPAIAWFKAVCMASFWPCWNCVAAAL